MKDLIKWTFSREDKAFLCTNYVNGFFSNKCYSSYKTWTSGELMDALCFLLDNIFIQFDNTIYRQVVGIPMGTNCAPLIADLFLYCFEKKFMLKLQKQKRHGLIQSFSNTSRYLDDILTIDNPFFERFIPSIYPSELQLNKSNYAPTECSFLDLNISIINGIIETKIYDKRDDFCFEIVNFPWLDGDVPRCPSYGIYISQLVRFGRACSNVVDFNLRNLSITNRLINQGFRYHKLRKAFCKFYNKYPDLVRKYGDTNCGELISKGISQPNFYGDIVYKIRRIKDSNNIYESIFRIFTRHKKRGYDPHLIERSIRMVYGPSTAVHRRLFPDCTLTDKAEGTI